MIKYRLILRNNERKFVAALNISLKNVHYLKDLFYEKAFEYGWQDMQPAETAYEILTDIAQVLKASLKIKSFFDLRIKAGKNEFAASLIQKNMHREAEPGSENYISFVEEEKDSSINEIDILKEGIFEAENI